MSSATGGLSTPAGSVRTASMAPTGTLLSSAEAFAAKAASRTAIVARAVRMDILVNLARLLRQHDRDAVADRISELGRARDQLLLGRIEFERSLGHGADQDFQELGIDGVFGAFGCDTHVRAPAICRFLA